MTTDRDISALYVATSGAYFDIPGVDPWDEVKDARTYRGNNPVVAHPPCTRWSKYSWRGSILRARKGAATEMMGDDGGCFAHALWAVRTFGGVIEHPAYSYAFEWHGLPKPTKGEWSPPDSSGGRSCLVYQSNYGHTLRKATWLYAHGVKFSGIDLRGSVTKTDSGWMVKGRSSPHGDVRRHTPDLFRDALISLAKTAYA